jgi:hypothetical protein
VKNGALHADDGRLVLHGKRTESTFERARGLLGRPSPAAGEGMLIEACAAIHTCAMAYPIDAVFLDRYGQVMRIAAGLAPWRFARQAGAAAVLELAAGGAAHAALVPGMRLRWVPDEP